MNAIPPEHGADRSTERKDSEAIARKLHETRAEVSQTLEALQAKLSPGQVLDRTLTFVRERGGAMASTLGQSARQNALPIVVTGMGLLWMLGVRSLEMRSRRNRTSPEGILRKVSEVVSAARGRLSSAADVLSDRLPLSGAASVFPRRRPFSRVTGMFSHRRPPPRGASMLSYRRPLSRATDMFSARRLSGAADRLSDTADAISDRLAGTPRAMTQVRRAGRRVVNLAQDRPLLVSALGLAALGLLIGYSRARR
jgi:Protein of unknown function (DUF3618)